ncbi:hypothetical protein A2363_04145 [Candidatus Gottesmanbacteria bacterium RIFOXYB1_FULL_47_11]|uniref:Mn transporter n=1 Tax=Candidatus Gottesmanbacteria bacterium RIFOXYB1_FULL_47_11 TaxID=1798401 RepID=A0A1F6BFX9_9BACT|nr:MAG: hypothetical protein A2363_04145 [Candidatus Gottesmanbacteria bacterium RIFOXYB1_FULL_47_11]
MKNTLVRFRNIIVIAMAVVGPGIITAFADNDAAGVATYSVSASIFGYRMLSILIPITIVLAITQEIGARIAIVAQKGLGDLIRERYGIRVSVLLFAILASVNFFVVVQNVSGIKAGLQLFGMPPVFLPIMTAILFFFIVLAKYPIIERFFFVLIGFYVVYIASAFLAKPDWGLAIRSLGIPQGDISPAFIYTSVAVLGTIVTGWGQFFINSYIKDKHVSVEHLAYSRWEIYIGAVITNIFSFFMMVAVAATLFVNRIHVADAASAALSIQPFAGEFAGTLFGLGLLAAGMLGAIIVPLATAYAFSEFFGYSGSLDETFRKSKLFYGLFLVQIAAATAIVLLPNINLFRITIAANFLNGLVLPVIFYFLWRIANSDSIMGTYKNTRLQNILLVSAGVVITIAAVFGGAGQIFGW